MTERCLLDRLLESGGLSPVFQPIFRIQGPERSVHALECLTRGPKGSNMESASVLFEYARRKREEARVDRACLGAALAAARALPGDPDLGINVHASTLGRDHGFAAFVGALAREHAIAPSRLIVEIVEHAPYWDRQGFCGALDGLRRDGVRIALDDVGLGQSNYKMILDCRPDYLKVDRYLVKGCHADRTRQAVLESVAHLADRLGARVVAEGVEDAADLEAVTALGIDLVQGFLFSPPVAAAALVASGLLALPVCDSPAAQPWCPGLGAAGDSTCRDTSPPAA
jgi:EAL domain-containing protein (putative c-di-GMP-specific phosphodiesterase class I)